MTPSGVAFDAFGTLFDLSALRRRAEESLGTPGGEVFDAYSERVVPFTWHLTAAGRYRPFPEVATLALEAAARERGVDLDPAGARAIAAGLASLPAYPDADAALAETADLPLAVLSNGTGEGIESLVREAGLAERFDHLLAADSVGRFKPAPEVYAMAVEAFGGAPESAVLVSANEWDAAGAKLSGLRAVWVSRGRPSTGFLGVEVDAVAEELADVPDAIRRLGSP